MPRIGMEPIRRSTIVEAAIAEIGDAGSLDVTVSQIAKRAGVSSALAHHYFGTKDAIFHASMRHILRQYGDEARRRLAAADTPRARIDAIVGASLSDPNFRPDVIAAWLNFYVRAQTSPEIARLLKLYRRRLRSNLLHALRQIAPDRADIVAEGIAALIDGLYLRRALAAGTGDPAPDPAILTDFIDRALGEHQ